MYRNNLLHVRVINEYCTNLFDGVAVLPDLLTVDCKTVYNKASLKKGTVVPCPWVLGTNLARPVVQTEWKDEEEECTTGPIYLYSTNAS